MPTVKVRGEFAMYYEEDGAGPRSVVVLGVDDPVGTLLAAQAAASDMRVVRYDPRGTGQTPTRPPHSLSQHASDLGAILRALKVMKPTLFAAGAYAPLGVAYAVRNLHDIRRLILMSPELAPADETKLGKVGEKAMVLLEPDIDRIVASIL
jgi:pimeloyl-ACP methyl ester carboxylesterase